LFRYGCFSDIVVKKDGRSIEDVKEEEEEMETGGGNGRECQWEHDRFVKVGSKATKAVLASDFREEGYLLGRRGPF
jgi:hypothetical protein